MEIFIELPKRDWKGSYSGVALEFSCMALLVFCVPTVLDAVDMASALPQRPSSIELPHLLGHVSAEVIRAVRRAANDDRIEVKSRFFEPEDWTSSSLEHEVLSAVQQVAHRDWLGVAVMLGLELGGTDGCLLRAAGIPTCGV
jgi:hypothetical protein